MPYKTELNKTQNCSFAFPAVDATQYEAKWGKKRWASKNEMRQWGKEEFDVCGCDDTDSL